MWKAIFHEIDFTPDEEKEQLIFFAVKFRQAPRKDAFNRIVAALNKSLPLGHHLGRRETCPYLTTGLPTILSKLGMEYPLK